jgi:hypothetical protein
LSGAAHPARRGVGGGREADRRAVHAQLARGRAQQARKQVHQRGLARAVLAEEGVDLAGVQGEVHAVERGEGPEAAGHPARLHQWRAVVVQVVRVRGKALR